MSRFLARLLVTSIALYAAVRLVPGIAYEGGWPVLVAMALIFGIVNAVVRPILTWLTCPLIILTMGVFMLGINGAMLLIASHVAGIFGVTFYVRGLGAALWGSIVVSIASFLMNLFIADAGEQETRLA